MSGKSPIHKLTHAVGYISNDQVEDDQITTLINSDDNSDPFGSNISQLQLDEGTYGCRVSHKRKPKVRVYKLFVALVTVIAVVLFVIIWASIRNQKFHKVVGMNGNSEVYAVLEYSSMNLSLYGSKNKHFLSLLIGKNLTSDLSYKKSKDCSQGQKSGKICMQWKNANLQIKPETIKVNQKGIQCFHVAWQTSEFSSPRDCIEINSQVNNNHIWFDTHNFKMWPKDIDQVMEYYLSDGTHLGNCFNYSLSHMPGSISSKTGIPIEKMGGTIVEPLWLHSSGILLKIGMHDHLKTDSTICKKAEQSHLCLGTENLSGHHGRRHHSSSSNFNASNLEYTICLHENIQELYNIFIHNFTEKENIPHNLTTVSNTEILFEDAKSKQIIESIFEPKCNLFFEKPLWNLVIQDRNYTQENIKNEIEDIKNISGIAFLNILSEISTNIGDYDVVKNTQNITGFIKYLHQSNLSVMLPVTPFIHHASKNLVVGLKNDYFVKSADGLNALIRITENKVQYDIGIIDLTNDNAVDWFTSNVKKFLHESGAEYLHFMHGQAAWLPQNYVVNKTLHNSAYFSSLYAMVAKQVSQCSVTNVAFSTQPLKQFVMLSSVSSIHLTIKEALSAGISGYPFFIVNLPSTLEEAAKFLDKAALEQGFIQWVEMVTFFPVMHIPWDYTTLSKAGVHIKRIAHVLKRCVEIRNSEKIKSVFNNAISEAWEFGKPIVRPMWMAAGVPAVTNGSKIIAKIFEITDQFLVGNDLLVAPVTAINGLTRNVYFPPGIWIDISSNHLINSEAHGRWESDYSAEQIPVFLRKS